MRIFKLAAIGVFTTICMQINAQKEITVGEIFDSNRFARKTVSGFHSMKNGDHYTVLENNSNIVVYEYSTGKKVKTLFSLNKTPIKRDNFISSYEFDPNEEIILLTTTKEYVYRRTYRAYHFVYFVKTKKLFPVYNKQMQMAKISPDGKHVAFIFNNNLYTKNIRTRVVFQITYDGKAGEVINGMPDWVYEEEFALKSAYEWSPDGEKVAFMRFREDHVKEFKMPIYNDLYPEYSTFKYPKAGEENAVVSMHVYNLNTGLVKVLDIGDDKDIYIPRFGWGNNSQYVNVLRLNRLQNKAEILLSNAETGESDIVFSESNDKFIAVEGDTYCKFLDDGKRFIVFSERSKFMHLYLYSIDDGMLNPITSGEWEVSELLGVDGKNEVVYYTSTEESPKDRQVYRIGFDGKGKTKLSLNAGVNRAEFSATFSYFINYHSATGKPLTVTLHRNNGELVRVLEDNATLRQNIIDYDFVEPSFFSFDGPGGQELLGYMYKPSNFDVNKKYPVLIYVYGGPGSQNVLNQWNRRQPWFQLLAQKGYIVASVDNRGTDGRGEAFKKSTYMQLGKYEVEDQLAAIRYLGKLSYIDKDRIGMFGWSYGGFMTLNCLMHGNSLLKMGVSVAPVTNWRFYDTIYTERYMRKPQNNEEGYDNNSPITHVEKLKGKLLLVHGTADDNVHYQNSMELVNKLVEAGKQFDMQFYPNKNHSIGGVNTRVHLYTKMTQFILENL